MITESKRISLSWRIIDLSSNCICLIGVCFLYNNTFIRLRSELGIKSFCARSTKDEQRPSTTFNKSGMTTNKSNARGRPRISIQLGRKSNGITKTGVSSTNTLQHVRAPETTITQQDMDRDGMPPRPVTLRGVTLHGDAVAVGTHSNQVSVQTNVGSCDREDTFNLGDGDDFEIMNVNPMIISPPPSTSARNGGRTKISPEIFAVDPNPNSRRSTDTFSKQSAYSTPTDPDIIENKGTQRTVSGTPPESEEKTDEVNDLPNTSKRSSNSRIARFLNPVKRFSLKTLNLKITEETNDNENEEVRSKSPKSPGPAFLRPMKKLSIKNVMVASNSVQEKDNNNMALTLVDFDSTHLPDPDKEKEHLTPDNNDNDSEKPDFYNYGNESIRCFHAGCYCKNYIECESKWRSGRCNTCDHSRKDHKGRWIPDL